MSDLNTQDLANTSQADGKNMAENSADDTTHGKPAAAEPGADTSVITFSAAQQAHIDRVIEDRLARQKSQFLKKEEDAKKLAEQKRLAEQGEFKQLADQRLAKIEELEQELIERELRRLRATAAAKHKLPEHWITRLVGTSEEEIDADAARLAKDLAPPKAPNAEGGQQGTAETKAQSLERAKKEALASGRYAS